MQKITPYLWFNNKAEEAANFYVSVFNNSKIINISRFGDKATNPSGEVVVIDFVLDGHEFTAMNGGPHFTFSPAISFVVNCNSQEEVDYYWEKLSEGGEIQMCGWMKDKFGVSWQVVPTALIEMMNDPDKMKAKRVINSMLQMKKIDIEALKKAREV
jgi:predicted 3-demethylubiquinone-9 3-methyltransferase (glyoxalase superfamily)